MGISSLVFYTLAARAPLVSSSLFYILYPLYNLHISNVYPVQTNLPHSNLPNNHHLLHNLPSPFNRPRHNNQTHHSPRVPQTCPRHTHRLHSPGPLAAFCKLGTNNTLAIHQLRPSIRPTRRKPTHRHRRPPDYACNSSIRHICRPRP